MMMVGIKGPVQFGAGDEALTEPTELRGQSALDARRTTGTKAQAEDPTDRPPSAGLAGAIETYVFELIISCEKYIDKISTVNERRGPPDEVSTSLLH